MVQKHPRTEGASVKTVQLYEVYHDGIKQLKSALATALRLLDLKLGLSLDNLAMKDITET